jgi:hypothetical protein
MTRLWQREQSPTPAYTSMLCSLFVRSRQQRNVVRCIEVIPLPSPRRTSRALLLWVQARNRGSRSAEKLSSAYSCTAKQFHFITSQTNIGPPYEERQPAGLETEKKKKNSPRLQITLWEGKDITAAGRISEKNPQRFVSWFHAPRSKHGSPTSHVPPQHRKTRRSDDAQMASSRLDAQGELDADVDVASCRKGSHVSEMIR